MRRKCKRILTFAGSVERPLKKYGSIMKITRVLAKSSMNPRKFSIGSTEISEGA